MKNWMIHPAEGELSAACACCAGDSGLRGFVFENDEPRAIYFVEPLGVFRQPMIKLGIVIGAWGPGSPAANRAAFTLLCKPAKEGPALSPADPTLMLFPEFSMLGERLSADALATHASLAEFIDLARAIIHDDARLALIRDGEAARSQNHRFSAEGVEP